MSQYKSKAYSMTMFSYNADKCLVHQRISNILHQPYDSWPKWSMLLIFVFIEILWYCIAAGWKFGEYGEISVIRQTKTIQIISNLLVDLFIHQTFSRQNLYPSTFAKHCCCQTFPLYSITNCMPDRILEYTSWLCDKW